MPNSDVLGPIRRILTYPATRPGHTVRSHSRNPSSTFDLRVGLWAPPAEYISSPEDLVMKWATAQWIVYGCLFIWMLAGIAAGATSETEMAIQRTGARLCPENTTPDHTTFSQTVRDSDGHTSTDIAWILQCKDANGSVIKEDRNYFLPWLGTFVGTAIAVTAPVLLGVFVAVLVGRARTRKV